ncbi:MAG TPA: hypothetical protein VMU13_02655 [Candidatus Paceibacterota bacterium]|nr:hypothetical protein [Candidatus Paceibacterota bacterium]
MSLPQPYPRIVDGDYAAFLDESKLKPHGQKLTQKVLKNIIQESIILANQKSGRAILNIPENLDEDEKKVIYEEKGKELFKYFITYYGDPANTAFDCLGRHFSIVAKEQFRNQTLQKERMNSGWRYQYIAKNYAVTSKRFDTVSDIGASEGDFNATVEILDSSKKDKYLNLYVSVKNRMNTMGGQDWPKAIQALEKVAQTDKNRSGPFICVFGIAMQRGNRLIKINQKTRTPYSVNTEVWASDFFWPFFSNCSYPEITHAVLRVLIEAPRKVIDQLDEPIIPDELVTAFGDACGLYGLIDSEGKFSSAEKLLDLFVTPRKK